MNATNSKTKSTLEPLKRKPILWRIAMFALVSTIIIIVSLTIWFLHSMRPLTVTLKNQTDSEIVSVEFHMSHMNETYLFERSIPAGKSRNIRPEFADLIEGELSFTAIDAEGKKYRGIACGYTSTLSGESTVTIDSTGVSVQAECS